MNKNHTTERIKDLVIDAIKDLIIGLLLLYVGKYII